MYCAANANPNPVLAPLQRTYNPTYTTYQGNGSGRDHHILINNGGLTRVNKVGMGHIGVHFLRYNSIVK